MKKSLFLIIILSLSFGLSQAESIWHPFKNNEPETSGKIIVPNSDNFKTTVIVDIPGFYVSEEVIDGATYHHIALPIHNGGVLTEIGSPELPVIARLIAIPANRDAEIQIVEAIEETFTGYNIYPYQPPLPEREDRIQNSEFVKDAKRYTTNTFYPEVFVTAQEPAILRDYRVLPLIIQPVRYNPVTKELVIARHLKIELTYSKIARKNIKTNFRAQISKTFEPFYRRFILNYYFVAPPQSPIDGSYLIITHDNFYSAVLPLAEWKLRKGWRTKIVKTSEIAPNPTATQIYNYIHNAYLNWQFAPDYVLLVGDVEYVPCAYGVQSAATDHYYTKHEGTDYFSDLLVARISVKNLTEAQTVVNKLVNYESNPFIDSTEWYRKATSIAGYESGQPTRFWTVCIRIMQRMLAYGYTQFDTLFQRWGLATPTNITNAVNEGRTWVLYRGHGMVNGWDNVEPDWLNSHVYALNNGRKVPMVIGPTCESGHYDDPSQDCHAEVWVKVGTPTEEKGGCGYFGASRVSYSGYNDSLAAGTFLGYCDSLLFTFAQSTNYGKLFMYQAYPGGSYTELEFDMFNNFGEPELNIWSAPPQQLTVNHPAVVLIGSFPFSVQVTAGGPVPNALVCVMSKTDTTIYCVGRTNTAGQVDFVLNATVPGDSIFVTVTGRNLYPYRGFAMTTAPNAPYVTFLRYIIDDSAGNNDGIVNPGETIELPLWVKNWGGRGAEAVVGILSTNDSLVTITDSVKSFGNIPANDSAYTGNDGYNFLVGSTCVNGHTIRFNLELRDANDTVWTSSFSVVVGTPVLLYVDKTVYDSLATTPNGKLDPGETVDLVVTLRNIGLGHGYNVSAILHSGDSWLTVLDSIGSFGTIPFDSLGNNLSDCFTVSASALIPQETPINCTLHILADGGYTTIQPFTIVVGEIRACDPVFDDTLYWAYEDIDTLYSECPVYEWIEINTVGTRLTLSDDQTVQITLPATFGPWRFYGQRYTQLSICSNGFIAPGSQTATAYLNRRLPDPTSTNPNGMVCGNWDDMLPNNSGSGGVYWYHDLSNHRFVIEYDSTPYYGATTIREKFEIIIYDTTIVTTTGDNAILLLHMTSSRTSSSTIGIEDPTNTYGITMSFNDTLNRGCGPWHPNKAVKYTTNPPYPQAINELTKTEIPTNTLVKALPNPFQGICQIQLQVRQEGNVSLKIYDITGREIRNLITAPHKPGTYTYYWNGQDEKGKKVATGIYFYQLETPNENLIRKLILVK